MSDPLTRLPGDAPIDVKAEYRRIGQERDAAGKIFDRERLRFWVMTLVWCWAWTIGGLVIAAPAFHIQAAYGRFYYPGRMLTAQMFLYGGMLVGTGGPLAVLILAWRKAMDRGYLDS